MKYTQLNATTIEIHTGRSRHTIGRFCLKTNKSFIYYISGGMIKTDSNAIVRQLVPRHSSLFYNDWCHFCETAKTVHSLDIPKTLLPKNLFKR